MSNLDDVSLFEGLVAFFCYGNGKCSVNLDMARKICRESLSYYAKIEKSDILERNYKVRKIEMKRKSG